jgi:hypothetical protein
LGIFMVKIRESRLLPNESKTIQSAVEPIAQ